MKLTIFIIALLVAVIAASQVYAWTRPNDEEYGFSERTMGRENRGVEGTHTV